MSALPIGQVRGALGSHGFVAAEHAPVHAQKDNGDTNCEMAAPKKGCFSMDHETKAAR